MVPSVPGEEEPAWEAAGLEGAGSEAGGVEGGGLGGVGNGYPGTALDQAAARPDIKAGSWASLAACSCHKSIYRCARAA